MSSLNNEYQLLICVVSGLHVGTMSKTHKAYAEYLTRFCEIWSPAAFVYGCDQHLYFLSSVPNSKPCNYESDLGGAESVSSSSDKEIVRYPDDDQIYQLVDLVDQKRVKILQLLKRLSDKTLVFCGPLVAHCLQVNPKSDVLLLGLDRINQSLWNVRPFDTLEIALTPDLPKTISLTM